MSSGNLREPERLLQSREGKRTGSVSRGRREGGRVQQENQVGAVGWKIEVTREAMAMRKTECTGGLAWWRGHWWVRTGRG